MFPLTTLTLNGLMCKKQKAENVMRNNLFHNLSPNQHTILLNWTYMTTITCKKINFIAYDCQGVLNLPACRIAPHLLYMKYELLFLKL